VDKDNFALYYVVRNQLMSWQFMHLDKQLYLDFDFSFLCQ